MNLLRIENRIYNFSLLIEAEFAPATQWVEETTGRESPRQAKLEMRFAAPEGEPATNYNGDYVGCENTSPYCRTLRGAEAEETWNALNAMPHR